MQKNREQLLDKESGRPSSKITNKMDVNVKEYLSSSELSRGRTPNLGSEIDDDSTQLLDDNEGGGNGDGIPLAIEESQGVVKGHLVHLQERMHSHMLHKTNIMEPDDQQKLKN